MSFNEIDNTVSVIIPCYNNSESICCAIHSVISQDYRPLQIIIVNDGSTDDTENKVLNYFSNNEADGLQLSYVSIENSGPSVARNLGLESAAGQYVAFLDADDEWLPNKLTDQLQWFKKDDKVAMVAGAFEVPRIRYKNVSYLSVILKQLIFKNYFFTPVVMAKTSVLKAYKFNENQKYSEDYRLWLQVCLSHKCIYINKVMARNQNGKATYGQSGLSAKLWKMEKGELSNFVWLLKNKHINITQFVLAAIFSLLKFGRRVLFSLKHKL